MAIILIEAPSGISNGTQVIINFATPTTGGELIVLTMSSSGNGNDPTSITDNKGQSYTLLSKITGGLNGHVGLGMYYKENSASGVTSVTMTLNTDTQGGGIAAHYTGVATSSSLDQKSPMAQAGAAPWTSATITTTNANDLLVGCDFQVFNTGSQMNPVFTSPLVKKTTITSSGAFDGGNGDALAYADLVVTSIQSNVAANGTDTGGQVSSFNGCMIASFMPLSTQASQLLPMSVSGQLKT